MSPDIPPRYPCKYVGDCEVRAFGSRGNGTAKEYSDLDLAIVGKGKIKRRVKVLLREAFEESNLPFRVDIVDYSTVSDAFGAMIEEQYEVIQQKPLTNDN